MDSPTSNNSLRRWQTALAVFCQAVSSVATVRLTWTKTWLLPKLRAEGRLPKLFQLATPATGWWMPAEERTGHPCYRVMNASWRTKNVLVRRKWFGIEQEVQIETMTDLIRHSRRFGWHSSRKLQAPQSPAISQSAATSHIRTSVRSLSLTVGSQKLYRVGGNERCNVRTNCFERRSSGSNFQRWADKIMILHA